MKLLQIEICLRKLVFYNNLLLKLTTFIILTDIFFVQTLKQFNQYQLTKLCFKNMIIRSKKE